MKKAVASLITSLGGSSKYSGKDDTMFVHVNKFAGTHRPNVEDPEKKAEIIKSVLEKFAKPDMPFKLA